MSDSQDVKFERLVKYISKAVKTHPFSHVKAHLLQKNWPQDLIDKAYSQVLSSETDGPKKAFEPQRKREILDILTSHREHTEKQEYIEELVTGEKKEHFFDKIKSETKVKDAAPPKKEEKDVVTEAIKLAEQVMENQKLQQQLSMSRARTKKPGEQLSGGLTEEERLEQEREEIEAERIAVEAERERIEALKKVDINPVVLNPIRRKLEKVKLEEEKKVDSAALEMKLSLLEDRLKNIDTAFEEKKFKKDVVVEEVEFVSEPVGDRAQTGIPGLDPIIQGGLRRHTSTLVAGGPGSGKSIFGMQFLINGIERFNEPGIYISFENSKKDIYAIHQQFHWDLQKHEKEKKMQILLFTPEQMQKVIESGGGTLRDAVDSIHAQRIVIDSVSDFLMLFKTELAQRKAFQDLFAMLAKFKATSVVTVEQETDPLKHNASILEYSADGVILLYNERLGDIRQRGVEVYKMRGTKHAGRVFPLKIVDSGIVILSGASK